MELTRRNILRGTGLIVLSQLIPQRGHAAVSHYLGYDSSDPKVIADVIEKGIDAAISAGATYADARYTHTYQLEIDGSRKIILKEHIAIGVRALVDGYWGFASSQLSNPAEASRLGKAAYLQAKSNDLGQKRHVDFSKFQGPPIQGTWIAPITDDPFELYPYEIQDFLRGLVLYMETLPSTMLYTANATFWKQIRHFGSSTGHRQTQTQYRTTGTIGFTLNKGSGKGVKVDCLSPAAAGFEYFTGQNLREKIYQAYEEGLEDVSFPFQPVDVGRYPAVISALGVAGIIGGTIGCATELDRVMGFEANAGGTSYLSDQEEILGKFEIGNTLLNVQADRTEPGAVATVKWDDEGSVPQVVPIVKSGVVHCLQTDREGAGWIRQPISQSTGGATAADATLAPLIQSGNLTLQPGTGTDTMSTMIEGLDDGILIKEAGVGLDFQLISGMITGDAYRIQRGKRTARIASAGILFRTPELWKSLSVLGGAASSRRLGMSVLKGEPSQGYYFSVTAVPALFEETTVIDTARK
jgi:TldD protein